MTKIYLISPPKIELDQFSQQLTLALETSLVSVFQLRLKDYPDQEIKIIAKELKKICHEYNCLFILNDSIDIALEIGADGVHLGVDDGSIKLARQKAPEGFVIGASCYDSRHLAMEAGEQGADYLSFGAFFPSKTKQSRGNPTTEILYWCDEIIDLPICAIGGIDDKNCPALVKAGADFLAVISYVWDNPLGAQQALVDLDKAIGISSGL